MRDVLRLSVLLACVALATSRLGLLAHELVGHGGTALVMGEHIAEVRLFWFAGGWVRYTGSTSFAGAVAITMGGIAVELLVASTLWCVIRGDSLGRRIVRGCAAAIVLHASWYLATGAFSGFGDGLILYGLLGTARVPVAIAAGAVTCAAAFFGAREVLGALAATQPRRKVVATAVAIGLAGGLHAGLALGELKVRQDRLYQGMMQPQRERLITQEIVRFHKQHPDAPVPVEQIEAAHPRTFPFTIVLAIATLLAGAAGAWRAKRGPPDATITRRLLIAWAVTAAVAIAVVIAV
jgi:hypothetical protein